jgi:hypothetical protein
MQPKAFGILIGALILTNGCNSQPTTNQQTTPSSSTASVTPSAANTNATTASPNASAPKASVDACTLLTSDEIKAVQGEPVKETKASDRQTGDFIVTQCYYELPTSSNSVSVTLTERNPDSKGGQSVKDFWERTFGKDENKGENERKKERDQEKKKSEAGREGEEEAAHMQPVRGVGDEAFWSASRVGGALYVLKRDRYIRISVGGKGYVESKLKKSKTLAQKALRRL